MEILLENMPTIREGGYRYVRYEGYRSHILLEVSTGNLERWVSRPDATNSYCMRYKNCYLEFAAGVDVVK